MRTKRLSLSETQQIQASKSVVEPALTIIEKYQATKIALYLPFNNEISSLPLIDALFQQGKQIYLPVLHPFSKGNLLFLEYKKSKNSLKYNR
ncbi:MAG: 5-formyltetrahydrofolate cyclo-ligase, partial [Pasteurellales bacterium]